MAQNPSIHASAPSDAYSHAGSVANTGNSILVCGWVRNPDYANSTWPYNRGNQQWLAIGGGSTGDDNWAITAICSNSTSATATSTDCRYNANTMVFCSNFSWVADSSYYQESTHTTAEIMGWVFIAVQVLVSAAGFTIRQWLKFGLDGDLIAAGESTVTLATCRAESYNGSWVVGAPAWIQFGGDPGMFTRLRCYAVSGTPTTAQLDAIAELDGADTTSDFAANLYADWEYHWDTTYDVSDRSGNSRDLTVEGSQVYLQGPDGPAFAAGGTTIAMSGASAGAATASGALLGRSAAHGTSVGASSQTAALQARASLSGASAGASSPSGALSGETSIVGASTGVATQTGQLRGLSTVAANSNGSATAAGALLGLAAMAAVSLGVATASGTLSTSSTAGLSGTSQGSSVATADVRGMASLSGSSAGTSTQSANLTATAPDALAGTSSGASTATGSLSVLATLGGSSTAAATASGSLLALASLAGTSAGASTQTGALLVASLLSGVSAGSSTVSDASLSGRSRFVGVSAGASVCTGSAALVGAGVVTGGSVTFAVSSVGSLVATVASLGSISMTRLNS